MKEFKCSVIGLGKLGSPLAAILGQHFPTIGVDVNKNYVDKINQGIAPVQEPGLSEILKSANLKATTNIYEAIRQTNITFIIVPTPSQSDGTFTNQYILQAIAEIGAAIARKSDYHLVSITSTVMPGSTRNAIAAALQSASRRKLGEDLGLTYNPEFIALGDVINGIVNPDMVLIGEPHANSKEGNMLEALYKIICKNCHNIARTSYENAEVAKLSLNTYLTMKVAYANTLGQICDALPNADAKEVTRIISQDTRISPKFLSPGMPFGGPCLPRDTVAFSALGKSVDVKTDIAIATKAMNEQHIEWIVQKICSYVTPGADVAILGLSYKAGSDVIEASTGITLCIQLAQKGYNIKAFDPLVKQNLGHAFDHSGTELQKDVSSCIANTSLIVIATPCKEFGVLKALATTQQSFPGTIVDCWRMFGDEDRLPTNLVYIGKSTTIEPQAKRARIKLG